MRIDIDLFIDFHHFHFVSTPVLSCLILQIHKNTYWPHGKFTLHYQKKYVNYSKEKKCQQQLNYRFHLSDAETNLLAPKHESQIGTILQATKHNIT